MAKLKLSTHDPDNKEAVMGITDHLREFRNRLAIILIVFVVAMLICLYFSADILAQMQTLAGSEYQFIQASPSDAFTQSIKISIICGLVVDSPIILYELFAFMRPGLKKTENNFVFLLLILGFIFFIIGAIFAYYIMLPIMLTFFFEFTTGISGVGVQTTTQIGSYVSLVVSTVLTLGLVFEMPVMAILLSQIGILRPEFLVKSRRIVIVVIFIIAAIITPPDVVSQIMVAIPMLILFEISIFFSRIIRKRKLKKKSEKEADWKWSDEEDDDQKDIE